MPSPKSKKTEKTKAKPKSRAKTEKISPAYKNLIFYARSATKHLYSSGDIDDLLMASGLGAAIARCEIIDGVK